MLTVEAVSMIPKGYATCSIGSPVGPTWPLEAKLSAIAKAGFDRVELSFPDLLNHAKQLRGHDVAQDDYDTLCEAAADAKALCQKHGLSIFILQPFANFEGWPKGSTERQDAFDRLYGWIRIMQACGTDMLQVGSSDSEGITTSREEIAADLRELADILAKYSFRVAYENWAWSTHAPTWRDIWEIAQLVDRRNFGLNVDTFQSAGYELADPRTKSGFVEDAVESTVREKWARSLRDLASTVPGDRIFFLQVSDAYKPPKPLEDKKIDGNFPRSRWSHSYRPLPFDGGYLPVVDFTRAVLWTGFRGVISIETFDGGPDGNSDEPQDLDAYARKAMEAYRMLLTACIESSTMPT